MKTTRNLAVAAALALLCGCTQIPTKQLVNYTEAFAQAHAASEQVLLDADQAFKEARALKQALKPAPGTAPRKPAPYPPLWEDASKTSASAVADDIEVRRRAFKVVADYNSVLVQLAEGKSVDDVKASTAGLLSSADKFLTVVKGSGIPGLSSLTGIVSTLIAEFEKARLREEFVKAVEKGSPVVDRILDELIADIGDHYDSHVVVLNRDRLRAFSGMRRAIIILQSIAVEQKIPADDRTKLEVVINDKFAVARIDGAELPVKLSAGGAKAQAYSEIAKAQVQDQLATIDRHSRIYVDNIAAAQSLISMLTGYRKLLETTRASLRTLVKSLHEPVDLTVAVDEMLAIAFSIRRDLRAYRAAIAE